MNSHFTYFIILICSVAGPLMLSFDKKVAFYKKWKPAFVAMLLPAAFYIVWDIIFTNLQVWFFNEKYVLADTYIYNLPLEEILFFFVVPYCCTFIYECIYSYFPTVRKNNSGNNILLAIGIIMAVSCFFTSHLYYTFYTALFLSSFIFLVLFFKRLFYHFNSKAFLISYCIIIIPFLIVNGFLTYIPVITYNDSYNSTVRIFTIPVEDIFYGMLLVMMNIVGYEKLLKRNKSIT